MGKKRPGPFRFKQFTLAHDRCAMKVGTDGVLLGAWVSLDQVTRVLDIGAGCGLLALMLAQRTGPDVHIEGVELEQAASQQAQENVAASPWPTQVQIVHRSLQAHILKCQREDTKYDLLISNPPFFVNSTKASAPQRSQARHTDTLGPDELLGAVKHLLVPGGRLALIYPTQEAEDFAQEAARQGLMYQRATYVSGTPDKPPKRTLMQWQKPTDKELESPSEAPQESSTLVIETGTRHNYTKAYCDLTKDFYLRM